MTFLEMEEVIKVYPGKNDINVQALRGISLELDKGKYYSIIGPSGSGKTTLMNLLSAYDRPTAGKITIENIGILSSLTNKKLREYHVQELGIIQQQFDENLFMDWTVEDNIIFPMRLLNQTSHEVQKKKVVELTKFLEIKDKLKRKVLTLSGGEAQRTSIAVALANDPKLVIADEPTGNLDSLNTLNIVTLFKKAIGEYGTTIISVTHNPLVANHADIAWKIVDGRIEGIYHKDIHQKDSETLKREYAYLDKDGLVKIPIELLKIAKITNAVEIVYNEKTGKIEISPRKLDQKNI